MSRARIAGPVRRTTAALRRGPDGSARAVQTSAGTRVDPAELAASGGRPREPGSRRARVEDALGLVALEEPARARLAAARHVLDVDEEERVEPAARARPMTLPLFFSYSLNSSD